jgi:hypothetical protein
MLDKGRMMVVEKRQWFERLRDTPREKVGELPEDQQLVRQFLRGDAEGPITARRAATNYAEDLLGATEEEPAAIRSVLPTRPMG